MYSGGVGERESTASFEKIKSFTLVCKFWLEAAWVHFIQVHDKGRR